MEKKNLISNWLNFNLSDKEQEAFDKLNVSRPYREITDASKAFKAPEFDVEQSYARFLEKRDAQSSKSFSLYRLMGGIAAAIVICLGLFYFLKPTQQTFIAENTKTVDFRLPDESLVILNDGSEVSFTEETWQENRTISLDGEAYFEVAAGSKFQVATSHGIVSVVGTKFNIRDRKNYFEVSCYEGILSVLYNNGKTELSAGESLTLIDGLFIKTATAIGKPHWLNNKSVFKSAPYSEVVDELERQYGISVSGDLRHAQTLFTGSFYHENLDTALQAITIPLKLEYSINGNEVILKSGK